MQTQIVQNPAAYAALFARYVGPYNALAPEARWLVDTAVHARVGQIVAAAPASITTIEMCGTVAAVRVIPRQAVDPVIPLWLACNSPQHIVAMREFWKALLPALTGWRVGRARRWARVVLHTVADHLTPLEYAYFEARLWAAFNGEAI